MSDKPRPVLHNRPARLSERRPPHLIAILWAVTLGNTETQKLVASEGTLAVQLCW